MPIPHIARSIGIAPSLTEIFRVQSRRRTRKIAPSTACRMTCNAKESHLGGTATRSFLARWPPQKPTSEIAGLGFTVVEHSRLTGGVSDETVVPSSPVGLRVRRTWHFPIEIALRRRRCRRKRAKADIKAVRCAGEPQRLTRPDYNRISSAKRGRQPLPRR
jgi:hypothetical protein